MSQLVHGSGTHDARSLGRKLRQHFGFSKFRPGQARAVQAAIDGRDTIVVMPTGSGKSVCFQLPALELEGTTIVVSPLIALMKDQADALRERGKSVVAINSTLKAEEEREALAAIAEGQVEFVYVTPERLALPEFREILKQTMIDLFVIDEAHCASQWGHDFRPEYLALSEAIDDLGRPTVLALTATATPDVIEDVRRQLRIHEAEVVHMGVDRPNLRLEVIAVAGESEKRATILQTLGKSTGPAIVYTATVKAVDELTEFLASRGFQAGGYHGRLKPGARTAIQDRFMTGELPIMVATNAFGLGIDKPDIRLVIHHHRPGTLEAYYQEAGRAGRDGLPSRCVLLHDPADRSLLRFFQAGRYVTGEDLVNAHHALKRLATEDGPHTLKRLESLSPLPKTRLKQALNLFKARGIVEEKAGEIHLIVAELGLGELDRVAGDYRERNERDLLSQQKMADFASTRSCRWSYLFDHFGRDESDEQTARNCGHCDNCA